VVSENGGDIIYTEAFENYKNYVGFSIHLCRGYNPESKGKIEAVVKYVKGNFLSCRVFHGITRLNSEGLAWLERTGMVHETTKMIPSVAFIEEQKHLKPAPELGETEVIPKTAIVRKNNIVSYRQNRYQMPKGTYCPGRAARIETDEAIVRFYDSASGEFLDEHKLAPEGVKGKCIRNAYPQRDRKTQYQQLVEQALDGFGRNEQAQRFIDHVLALKPRYTRDQLSMIIRFQAKHSLDELSKAVSYCMERELFTAADFGDTLEYFATKPEMPKAFNVHLPVKYSIVTAEKRSLDTYVSLSGMNGGVGL